METFVLDKYLISECNFHFLLDETLIPKILRNLKFIMSLNYFTLHFSKNCTKNQIDQIFNMKRSSTVPLSLLRTENRRNDV